MFLPSYFLLNFSRLLIILPEGAAMPCRKCRLGRVNMAMADEGDVEFVSNIK
jgi:hypothetical protein